MTAIPAGWMGLDIGPKTLETIQAGLADCKTGKVCMSIYAFVIVENISAVHVHSFFVWRIIL